MTGTEQIARGLLEGGIGTVTAFPGTPATVLAQWFEANPAVEFRWSSNENTATAHAFGAVMAGGGAAVIMKHVGINVALDALQVMGVVHTLPAPFIVVEGADARPGSSQSAQDNRPVFAGSMNALVFAPTSPTEARILAREACKISAAVGMMVVLRGEARMFKAEVDAGVESSDPIPSAFRHAVWPGRWALATSARTYAHHLEWRDRVFDRLSGYFSGLVESWGPTEGELVVLVAGHLGADISLVLRDAGVPGLRLLLEHPLPEQPLRKLLDGFRCVVVLEECLPHLENSLRAIAQRAGLSTVILGRADFGDKRRVGTMGGSHLTSVVEAIAQRASAPRVAMEIRAPTLQIDETVLRVLGSDLRDAYDEFEAAHPLTGFTVSDLRGPLFRHLRNLGGTRPTFVATDPGITGVLALAGALTDVKMHMGCAVPIAAGWARARPDGLSIAVVGDTNLPHSEWLGLVESAACRDHILVVVVDNGYSEMTQRIVTARPSAEAARASLTALGIKVYETRATLDPADPWATTLTIAAEETGPRLVWVDVRD